MPQRSKSRQIVQLRPLAHMYDIEQASINQPFTMAAWPSMNIKVGDQRSITPRQGFLADRTLPADENVLNVTWYKKRDATEYTIYLTDHDFLVKKTGAGETYKYYTPTYSAGHVTTQDYSKVITGDTTSWTGNVAVGDKFIASDDYAASVQPDDSWGTIKTVDSNTQLTLEDNYHKSHGSGSDYLVRRLFNVTSGQRWTYCIVVNKFVFTCGATYTYVWDGTDTNAYPAHTTYANQARYCISFADRLILADLNLSAQREPWTMKWSTKLPALSSTPAASDWEATDAGEQSFTETEGFITGLGIIGGDMAIYKDRSIIFGSRTGVDTAPFQFGVERRGVGLAAPYSLVHAMSTNFFLGQDDFYIINGDHPESIGKRIRGKFFEMVPRGEIEKVFGYWSRNLHMILWVANTTTYGQVVFAYDYINMEWLTWKFHMNITGVGEGS